MILFISGGIYLIVGQKYGVQSLIQHPDIECLSGTEHQNPSFEIEYCDREGRYREACLSNSIPVNTLSDLVVVLSDEQRVILWHKHTTGYTAIHVLFSNGISKLIDFRLPYELGGISILQNVI
ncbi:MAG: hypothetical protein WC341_09130, partial [Bacteroidales bacterium]